MKCMGLGVRGQVPGLPRLGWGQFMPCHPGCGRVCNTQATSPCLPPHVSPCSQYTRKKDNASEGQALLDFARGLSGGAPVPRSKYLFDAVNLPQVCSEPGWLAADVLVGSIPAWAGTQAAAAAVLPLHLALPLTLPCPPPAPPRSSTTWQPRPWCSIRTAAPRSEGMDGHCSF